MISTILIIKKKIILQTKMCQKQTNQKSLNSDVLKASGQPVYD